MSQGVIRVKGLSDLNRALARTSKEVRVGIRKELASVAEPIRSDAESFAGSKIRNLHAGDRWAGMRTGVSIGSIYVVPKPRGVKKGNKRKRSNLADLLMDRAMQPALDRNAAAAEREVDEMLGRVSKDFSK